MSATVLLVTSDLFTSAPIEQAARMAGGECRVVSPKASVEIPPECPLVIIDLAAVEDITALVESIQTDAGPQVPVVAFGPHVHENRLAEAQAAGCTQVLTRGQFHRNVQQIVDLAFKGER